MTTKQAKKLGFWSALAMVVGTVVGSGIFFKNNTIFSIAGGNGWLALASWIVGGLIALSVALSFVEISSSAKEDNGGLGQYSQDLVGTKFGRFVRFNMPMFYGAIYVPTIATFACNFILKLFDIHWAVGPVTYFVIIGGILVTVALLLTAGYSPGASRFIQNISTLVKLIPLCVVGIVGILSLLWVKDTPSWTHLSTDPHIGAKSGMNVIMAALPGVMFAFDGYIDVCSVQKNVVNRKRNVPLAIGVGMISVTVLYLLLTISQANVDSRDVGTALVKIFGGSGNIHQGWERVIYKIVMIMVIVSALGSANGLSIAWVRGSQQLVDNGSIAGHGFVKKKVSSEGFRQGTWAAIASYFLVNIIAIVVSLAKTTGVDFYDIYGTWPAEFTHVVYFIIIIYAVRNRWTNRVDVHKRKFFLPVAITAISLISVFIVYHLCYQVFIYGFMNFNDVYEGSFSNGIVSIMYILAMIWYVGLWALNEKIVKRQKNKLLKQVS